LIHEDDYVLIAEDDGDDFLLAKEALEECCPGVRSKWVRDGEELFSTLERAARLPSVILLDLNMPKLDGREALVRLKGNERWRHVPVLVLSGSAVPEDVIRSNENGVNGFFRKSDYSQLRTFMETFGKYWIGLEKEDRPSSLDGDRLKRYA
jgi:CheY-like chemotaxis protein